MCMYTLICMYTYEHVAIDRVDIATMYVIQYLSQMYSMQLMGNMLLVSLNLLLSVA